MPGGTFLFRRDLSYDFLGASFCPYMCLSIGQSVDPSMDNAFSTYFYSFIISRGCSALFYIVLSILDYFVPIRHHTSAKDRFTA